MEHAAKVNFKVQNLILDYALGAAIAALLPIPEIGLLKAIALILLNLFLIRGIARLWQFQKGGNLLAWVGVLFGLAGSIVMAFLAWLGILILTLLLGVPRLMVVAPGVVAFCYFLGFGQTVHHFYLSRVLRASVQSRPSGEPEHET
jgi:hypothetical protein